MSFHQQYYSSYESPYSSTDIIIGTQIVKGETNEERFISGNMIYSFIDYIHRIYLVLMMSSKDAHPVLCNARCPRRACPAKSLVFLLTIISYRSFYIHAC
jgi:hypothetical protein